MAGSGQQWVGHHGDHLAGAPRWGRGCWWWRRGVQGEVVEDEQLDAVQLAQLVVVSAVHAGRAQALERLVSALEEHRVAATDRGVPERDGQTILSTPTGPHDQRVGGVGEEAQRAQLRPQLSVVGDRAGVVPGFEHRRSELVISLSASTCLGLLGLGHAAVQGAVRSQQGFRVGAGAVAGVSELRARAPSADRVRCSGQRHVV